MLKFTANQIVASKTTGKPYKVIRDCQDYSKFVELQAVQKIGESFKIVTTLAPVDQVVAVAEK
jgi:hypothetical protein